MRVVLDTNILVRAAKPGAGPARELLDRLRLPPHCLIASPFLLSELQRVLSYPRVQILHGLSSEETHSFIQDIHQMSEVVQPAGSAPGSAIAKDPDDDPILQTAVLGSAGFLCTRDRHFQSPEVQKYGADHDLHIIGDVELLQLLRQAESVPEAKGAP